MRYICGLANLQQGGLHWTQIAQGAKESGPRERPSESRIYAFSHKKIVVFSVIHWVKMLRRKHALLFVGLFG